MRSRVGEGGMGTVYLARDTQLDRLIAIKLLPAQIARDQQRLHRFLQEARAAAALSHPNIAHIYEIGEADGGYFIAMEYVEGRPPANHLSERQAIQLAHPHDKAHSKRTTHRNMRDSSIMRPTRRRPKILNMGSATM